MSAMAAAIYARKSNADERSNKDGKSIARQEELAREFITKQPGWTQGPVFQDDAISGAEFVNRPGYQRMMQAARKGQFRVLVMMALNRLGRDQARVMYALTELHDAGVAVWTYQRGSEVKLDTAQDILIASVEAFADAAYRESIQRTVREAIRKKAERGHVPGGRVFGYRNVKVAGHTEREINEQEAVIVRRIFSRRAEGWGAFKIASELETLGIPSPRGKSTWTEAQVSIICRNPLYRGEQVWGRTAGVHKGGTSSRIDSPENIIRTPVPHLRIVDEKLWAQVQAHMDRVGERYKAGLRSVARVSPGLLSPIAACGICGGSMYLRRGTDRRSGKDYPSYVCTRNQTKGARRQGGCQNNHRLPMERADEAVLTKLEDQFLAGDGEAVVQIIMAELSRMQRNQDDRASIEANITETERQIDNLMKGLAHVGSSPAISKAIKEREEDLGGLRAQLDQIQTLTAIDIQALMVEAARRAADWKGYLRSNPLGIVQTILRKLFPERIRFTPGDKGVWTFEGKLSYGKLLEGLIPKSPRTGPSSSW